jgi:hypothetical protein
MNLALAVIVLAFVLYQGADVPAYRDMPPIIGGIEKSSPADKAGCCKATGSCAWTTARSRPGISCC